MAGRFVIEDDAENTPPARAPISSSRFVIEDEPATSPPQQQPVQQPPQQSLQPQQQAQPTYQRVFSPTRVTPLSSARDVMGISGGRRVFKTPEETRQAASELGGMAVSGSMGVARGLTLGLAGKQIDKATEAMPSIGLTPSKGAEVAGQFAGVIAPWEGIASAVNATFGLANAGRIGRIVTQAATGSIVGATEASNSGRDIADEAIVGGASAGLLTGATEIPGAVRNSDWWRMMTNRERGLVIQSIDDVRAGLVKNGMSEGEAEAKIARLDPESFQAALKKRMAVEGVAPEAPIAQERTMPPRTQPKPVVAKDKPTAPAPVEQKQLPYTPEEKPKASDLAEQIKSRRFVIEDEEGAPPSDQEQGKGKSVETVAPEEEPATPADTLRPAIREGNDTIVGAPGSTHPEIIDANGIGPDHERGFVAGDGEFMTRAEAKDWMKQNQPELYDAWVKENGEGAAGELHSQDLNAATEEVQNAVEEGQIQPGGVTEHPGNDGEIRPDGQDRQQPARKPEAGAPASGSGGDEAGRGEIKRTFEPQAITKEKLPADTAKLTPSKAEKGKYYHATAQDIQAYVDKYGDGNLYRVANIKSIGNGLDNGFDGYKHQFAKGQSAKVHSFTTSLEDAKRVLDNSEDGDNLIVYRISPADVHGEFTVQVPSERGKDNALHVQSPVPAPINKATVVYRKGEWLEGGANDSRGTDERAEADQRQAADIRDDAGAGQAGGGSAAEEVRLSHTLPEQYTTAAHDDLMKVLADGEPVEPATVQQAFKSLRENKEAIKAELAKSTIPELLKRMGSFGAARYKGEKKATIVSAVYNDMVTDFAYLDGNGMLSYSMGKDAMAEAVQKRVDRITPENLKAHAEKIAQQREEYRQRREGYVKAIKNPETWEDFQKYKQLGYKIEDLPQEKRDLYDELHAEHNKEVAAKQTERKATVRAASGTVESSIVETKHTKTGEDLFVVKTAERVERDVYNEWNTTAKRLGGWYSSYAKGGAVPGFQFKTKENAEAFQKYLTGDTEAATEAVKDRIETKQETRKENAAERLTALAESMEEKANGVLNADRLTNTAKRAAQANSTEDAARKQIALAKTIRNIAEAIQEGEAKHLEGISAGTHVETLDSILNMAKFRNLQKNGKDGWSVSEERHRPPNTDDIEHVEYPYPAAHRDNLRKIGQYLQQKPGGVRDGDWLMKKYKEPGGPEWGVEFRNQVDIERLEGALKKAGTTNRDIKYDVENTVDRMVNYKRLQKMGLVDLPTLRAGLREYLQFKDEGPKADKAKQLERALVGKNVGVDFFPTPPEVAADMVERAGIKPGMKVLEPGGGTGNIAEKMRDTGADVDVAEISEPLREVLEAKGFNLVGRDFLDYEPGAIYDSVILNPPFSADIEHVRHAYELLKPGGKLVAIVGEGSFGNQKKHAEFKQWLEDNGASEEKLPEGTFTDRTQLRTTGANARLIEMEKGEESGSLNEKPAPLRMDGTTRPEKPTKQPAPEFTALHPKAQEKFNAAWDARDIAGMKDLLHMDNKGLRAEFASRTGEKLPRTVKGTDAAVEEYFTRVQDMEPEQSAMSQKSEVSEDTLIDAGLLYHDPRNDLWKYKFSHEQGNFFTANTKEDAIERASAAYDKMPESERLTKQQRFDKATAKQDAELERRYGKMSVPELEERLERLGGEIASLQKAGEREFNGGGRRTAAAVSNEGARAAGQEKMDLARYIETRKARADYEAARVTGQDTPAEVVAEAVKTAKKEGTPLKEQKKYLLANIEDAIKEAPDAPTPERMKLQNELGDLRGALTDAHNRKDEAGTKLNLWKDPQYFQDSTPERRQEMIAQFQSAHDVADADMKRVTPQIKAAQQALRDASAYVTIHVPDDGTFEVYNSKNALQNFKKQVETLFPSAEKAQAKSTGYGNLPKQTTVKPPPLEGAGVFTGELGTWHGTGHLMVKGEPQIKIKPSKDKTVNERNEAWKANPPDISRMLPDKKNLDRVENIDFVGHGTAGAGGKNGEVLAVSGNPIDTADKAYARLRVEGKPDVYVDQDYFLYAKQHYPNAEIYADGNKQGPVLFYENGGPVAVVMPVREHTLSAEMKALKVPKGETANHQTPKGTELYDITSVVPLALKELTKLAKSGREAMPHLEAIGRAAYEDGARKYQDFTRSMKEKLGDLWDRFKGLIQATWENVKRIVGNERGSTEGDDLRKVLIRRHNEFLDKADEAVTRGDEETALKWLARADELAKQIRPEKSNVIPLSVKPTSQQRTTGIKNDVTEEERDTIGKSPVEVETRRTFGDAFERGKALVDSGQVDPRLLAASLAEKPRALSAEESVTLIYDRMRLQNDHVAVMEQIEKATAAGDQVSLAENRQRLAKIEDDINTNDEAARRTGYEQGLGLAARKMMIAEDYSLARSIQRVRVAIGKPEIPEAVRTKIEALTKQLDEAMAKSKAHEERIAELEAQRKVTKIHNEEASAPRRQRAGEKAVARKSMDTEFKSLAGKLRSILSPNKLTMNFDPEAVVVLAEMARNRVIAGITDAKAIIDDIYEELKDIPDLEKRDIRDAISGYGHSYKMSQEEIQVEMREARRQMRLISALEDAEAGQPPLHSGLQRDPVSDTVRDLQHQVKEAMKASGIDSQSTRTPEEQWKTSLDAAKTRLRNQIHDITEQIKTGKKTPKKIGLKYDEEANALKAERDRLKKALEDIEGKPGLSDEQRVRIATNAVEKSITELDRQIKTRDVLPHPKTSTPPETPELQALRKKRDGLRSKRDELRKAYQEMQKKQVPDESPEMQQLKKFMADTERQVKAATDAAQRSLDEYTRRIKENDLAPGKKTSATPETPELKALRDRRDALAEQYKQMQRDAKPAVDPEQVALKAYKTRTMKRIADLQEMLNTGNYEKSARRVLKMDPEAIRLKAETERLKEAINTEIRKQELANRTAAQRGLDWLVKWRRAVILSGAQTIGKLTTAASLRQITTPLEELVGGVLSHTPYISRIAAKAPREGGGLNVRAEAAAMRQWFAKQTYMDAWDVIKTGRGELDRLYGKKHDLPPEAIEFFGHIHGALKIMPKRAEFNRSLQKRTEWYMKNGYDVSDPVTQATLFAESYVDANRAIFMQDNAMVTAYRMLINYARHKGTGGRAAATGLQMVMPIVKIPTNFVAETLSYAAGGAKAIAKVIGAKGIEGLKPEEADYVMRALKKQGIGAAVLVLGYLAADSIGGYYQQGERRKQDDVKAGGLRVFGVDMPRWALHTPALEVLQIGATLRRVEDHYAEKGKEHGTAAGVFAGAKGVIEEVPFFEQPVRMGEAMRTAESAGQWGGQFAESLLVPPDLRRISKMTDMAGDEQIPREQRNLWQILQADIPGQRGKLPLDMAKVKRMQIDKLADIMENAPSDVVEELKPAFRKKFRNSKGLTQEERERYLEIIRE